MKTEAIQAIHPPETRGDQSVERGAAIHAPAHHSDHIAHTPTVTVNGTPLPDPPVEPAVSAPPKPRSVPSEVRVLLAELELLSHGQTQRIDPAPAGGGEGRILPPGELSPPHVELAVRYAGCRSDRSRAVVVGEMRAVLASWRGLSVDRSKVREESFDELAARIVGQGVGLLVPEAALIFRCTPTFVRRSRLAADRDSELGKPVGAARPPDPQERADRAEVRRLREVGLSVRAIALSTGVARSTVQRWIAEAA